MSEAAKGCYHYTERYLRWPLEVGVANLHCALQVLTWPRSQTPLSASRYRIRGWI